MMMGCSKKSTESNQPNPIVSFDPANIEISAGNTTQIRLRIDDFTQSIFAASFQIDFDDSKISIADSFVTGFESIFGENVIRFIRVDSSMVRLSITRIQGDSAFSGSGIICGLYLTAISEGVCSLVFRQAESYFYDIEGDIVTIDSLKITPAVITIN